MAEDDPAGIIARLADGVTALKKADWDACAGSANPTCSIKGANEASFTVDAVFTKQ